MSEAEYTLAKDWLRADEQVIWSSVMPHISGSRIVFGPQYSRIWKAAGWFAVSGAAVLCFLMSNLEGWSRDAAIMLTAFPLAFGLFEVIMAPHVSRLFHLNMAMPGQSFLSCVVTNQRVLLFNSMDHEIFSLDRQTLAPPMPDYHEGSQAVLFTSPKFRERYLFVTTDFTPVLRALAPAKHS